MTPCLSLRQSSAWTETTDTDKHTFVNNAVSFFEVVECMDRNHRQTDKPTSVNDAVSFFEVVQCMHRNQTDKPTSVNDAVSFFEVV